MKMFKLSTLILNEQTDNIIIFAIIVKYYFSGTVCAHHYPLTPSAFL